MIDNEIINAFEAILFASGEPVSIQRLSLALDLEVDDVKNVADKLSKRLDGSGLELLTLENTYQLSGNKKYADSVRRAFDIKRKTPLSQAAFEVLAVVAYNQPVTKAFIEQVRGVDCSGVLSTLVEKELIEERGRLELPGRPLLYGTTKNFLRCFSISDLSELPQLPDNDFETKPDIGEQLSVDEEAIENTEKSF